MMIMSYTLHKGFGFKFHRGNHLKIVTCFFFTKLNANIAMVKHKSVKTRFSNTPS